MKASHKPFKSIDNRQARFDYEVLETLEAGIVLTGPEVKSVRAGKVQLKDSFARVVEDQVFVHNLTIQPYPFARLEEEYDPKQARRLLLNKKEIARLAGLVQRPRISLIPLKLYQSHNRFKLALAVARGKKQYEKREQIKRSDQEREARRMLKGATRYRG